MNKVDWTKPLEHSHGHTVSYVGKQTLRDGEPIRDGCVHLILTNGSNAGYVNDRGQVPKRRDEKGEVVQWLTIIQNKGGFDVIREMKREQGRERLTDLQKKNKVPTQLEEQSYNALGSLTEAIDALREVAETEGQNLRKLLHQHMQDLAKVNTKTQDDFLAALKLATDTLHVTIVTAIREGLGVVEPKTPAGLAAVPTRR